MIPTDEMIDRACAEVCGWRDVVNYQQPANGKRGIKAGTQMGIPPSEVYKSRQRIPNYCNDKNALPELLAAVLKNSTYKFASNLPCGSVDEWGRYCVEPDVFVEMLAGEHRVIVVAALKALGKWPAEWEE